MLLLGDGKSEKVQGPLDLGRKEVRQCIASAVINELQSCKTDYNSCKTANERDVLACLVPRYCIACKL